MAANRQLDLVALALFAIACIGIEHRNYGTIDMIAGRRAAAACPENESTPYSPECFYFIAEVSEPHIRWPATPAWSISTAPPDPPRGRDELSGSPCPGNNESVPYSQNCIKFLSGWFWHPKSIE
jgi:hypothetical protein